MSQDGTIAFALWQLGSGSPYTVQRSKYTSGNWSSPTDMAGPYAGFNSYPNLISVSSDGSTAIASWYRNVSFVKTIQTARYENGAWGSNADLVGPSSSINFLAQGANIDCSKAFLAWEDTTTGGTGFVQKYLADPVVTSISPDMGTVGTNVLVQGTGLLPNPHVFFGAVEATIVGTPTITEITATSPIDTGTVHVTVTTDVGTSAETSSDLYTYLPPTVTSVTPNMGVVGTNILVQGAGFLPNPHLFFGAVEATIVGMPTLTEIMTTSPTNTGTVHVTVTTDVGTSAVTPSDLYTYESLPPPPPPAPPPSVMTGGSVVQVGVTSYSGVLNWIVPESIKSGTNVITRIEIYRKLGGYPVSSFRPIKIIGVPNPILAPETYSDNNLQVGAVYDYEVRARVTNITGYVVLLQATITI